MAVQTEDQCTILLSGFLIEYSKEACPLVYSDASRDANQTAKSTDMNSFIEVIVAKSPATTRQGSNQGIYGLEQPM